MDEAIQQTNFLYTGLAFLVSFIALFGFLAKANVVLRIVWEVAFLLVGVFIIKGFYDKKRLFKTATAFYVVNLVLAVIVRGFIKGDIMTNVFFVFSLVLFAIGLLFSVIQMKRKGVMVHIEVPKIDKAPKMDLEPVDIEAIAKAPAVESYGKKPKKAKKKTAKKKKAKKKAKKAKK